MGPFWTVWPAPLADWPTWMSVPYLGYHVSDYHGFLVSLGIRQYEKEQKFCTFQVVLAVLFSLFLHMSFIMFVKSQQKYNKK